MNVINERPSLILCGGDSPYYAPSGPPPPRCRRLVPKHDRLMLWRPRRDLYVCPRSLECGNAITFDDHWATLPEEYRQRRETGINAQGRRWIGYSDAVVHQWRDVTGELPGPLQAQLDLYEYDAPETWLEAAELVACTEEEQS